MMFCQHIVGEQEASLRLEMQHANLMAWFTTHCEGLKYGDTNTNKDSLLALRQYEGR